MLCSTGAALAQETPPATPEPAQTAAAAADDNDDDDTNIIITATRRSENLQDVPMAITALGTQTLDQLQVDSFGDYARLVPSMSSNQLAPGFNQVYFRGVASGENANHSASLPSVGTYLDEQPITTVQGNLDVHLYDIARVEALAGPQGTLYGASSQAGTIRIITNKPDPSGFDAGYDLETNYVDMDDVGYSAEGFVNLPMGENAALRLVGWYVADAGWIDNKPATRTYTIDQSTTADDFTTTNDGLVEDNYNTVDTVGARAALRINLGENWSVTPQLMYQKMEAEGSFADDLDDVLATGSAAVAHFREEFTNDEWYQAGLTIEGSLGGLDVVYSGNYLDRDLEGQADYSDYSFFYDNLYTTGYFARLFVDDDENQLNPDAAFANQDYYSKTSHEIRVTTPQDKRARGLLGLFYQKQFHDFYQPFGLIEGLADDRAMNGLEPGGAGRYASYVYLNSMDRTDIDEAVFGQLAFDLTDAVELSFGARYFEPETKVKGFFGFGLGLSRSHIPGSGPDGILGTPDDAEEPDEPGDPRNGGEGAFDPNGQGWSPNGEWRCPSQADSANDEPCQNVDKSIKESDSVYRVNLTWKATDTSMLYGTWSEGYRPGGINRNPFAGEYVSDFLTNYELGWKTRFADDRLQFNGAVFLEEWDDIQIAFQGANGIVQVGNGPEAEIQGVETQIDWLPTDSLRIGVSLAYYDSELKDDYCPGCNDDGSPWAPAGTPLPVTPDFKGNLIARYTFPLGGFEGHLQGAYGYQASRPSIINVADNELYGDIPSSNFLDLAFGVENDKYAVELFLSNVTDEDAPIFVGSECTPQVCGVQPYGVMIRPRTVGLRFSQDF